MPRLVAFISDIHSNFEALEAVLRNIKEQGVNFIYCLGDVVGYAADPKKCMEAVLNHKLMAGIITGNHDQAVVVDGLADRFNYSAKEGIKYSKNELSSEHIQAIGSWPKKALLKEYDISLAHGSWDDSDPWKYLDPRGLNPEKDMKEELEISPCQVHIVGHSHKAFTYQLNDKYLLNPGSVGQPRDRDVRASYLILEIGEVCKSRSIRVKYDIEITINKIKRAGLPDFTYERLSEGK